MKSGGKVIDARRTIIQRILSEVSPRTRFRLAEVDRAEEGAAASTLERTVLDETAGGLWRLNERVNAG